MQRYPKEIEDKAIATSLEHENCLLRIKIIKLEHTIDELENQLQFAKDEHRDCEITR
jgi:hypothetical protein